MTTNQQSALPQSIRDAIGDLGARFDAEVLATTRALFENRWDMSPPSGAEMRLDLAYGPDNRHKIDLFPSDVTGAPLLIFVPGGGFVGGDKSLYRHVGAAFARLGFTTEPEIGEANLATVLQKIHERGYCGLVELEHVWSKSGLAAEQRAIDWLTRTDSALAAAASGAAGSRRPRRRQSR